MLPEIERQLAEDDSLWPNVKGLFIITVTKKRKPAATWYLLLQGKDIRVFLYVLDLIFLLRKRSSACDYS